MRLESTKTGATRNTQPIEHTDTTYVTHSATYGVENNQSTNKVTHFTVCLHDVKRLYALKITRREAIELRSWIDSQIQGERVYEELIGYRNRNVTVGAPDFPKTCPTCSAPFTRISTGNVYDAGAWYSCGGKYERKSQIQNHTDYFWGECGKQVTA